MGWKDANPQNRVTIGDVAVRAICAPDGTVIAYDVCDSTGVKCRIEPAPENSTLELHAIKASVPVPVPDPPETVTKWRVWAGATETFDCRADAERRTLSRVQQVEVPVPEPAPPKTVTRYRVTSEATFATEAAAHTYRVYCRGEYPGRLTMNTTPVEVPADE